MFKNKIGIQVATSSFASDSFSSLSAFAERLTVRPDGLIPCPLFREAVAGFPRGRTSGIIDRP